MYPTKKRPKQGHVTYKCFHCKRTEKKYTDGNPWNQQPLKEEEDITEHVKFTVFDNIEKVIVGMMMDENYLEKLEEQI